MENILFKISFPAEFHAQTAVEAAIALHKEIKSKVEDIARIEISTHESAVRIIDKTGPLKNPADRDHCLQYMVAVALLKGTLTAEDYEDQAAADPRIDHLRSIMTVKENRQYSLDYLDPTKRSIASAVTLFFADGTTAGPVAVEYPLGHRRRRQEGIPLLYEKCEANLRTHYDKKRAQNLLQTLREAPSSTPIRSLLDAW